MKELNGCNEKLLIVLFPYYFSDNSCYDFTFNIPETFPNIDISPSVYGYGGSGTEVDNFNEKQYSEEDQEYKPDIADEIEIEEYDQKDPIPMKSVTTVNNDKKDPTQATLNSKANFFKKSEFIEIKPPADTRNSDIKTSGEIESKLQEKRHFSGFDRFHGRFYHSFRCLFQIFQDEREKQRSFSLYTFC